MTNSVDPVQSATKLTDLKHDCLQRQGGYIRVQQGQALFVPKTIPSSFSLVKTDSWNTHHVWRFWKSSIIMKILET